MEVLGFDLALKRDSLEVRGYRVDTVRVANRDTPRVVNVLE